MCRGAFLKTFDKPLSAQEEKEMLERCRHGDRTARNVLIEKNMRLVAHIVKKYASTERDYLNEDLISVGTIGLIKAIEFYNPDISTKFKTYASYLITGEIRHYLRDKASMIKAPREIQELAFRINNYIKQLVEESGDEPTTEEVAKAMDVSVQKVNIAIEVDRRKNTISLDQTFNTSDDDNISLADKIPSGDHQEILNSYEEKIMLSKAIEKLPEDLKAVIELNYYEDLNQRQIAEKLGISQMQVSRRLKKALSAMYDIITNSDHERNK